MQPQEAFDRRAEFRFIDVRQPYEWDAGHVEEALHIPLQELPQRYTELDPETPIVVTCQVGQRSALATKFLREKGYDAHNLEGGVSLWAEQRLPLVGGQGPLGEVVDGWAEDLEW